MFRRFISPAILLIGSALLPGPGFAQKDNVAAQAVHLREAKLPEEQANERWDKLAIDSAAWKASPPVSGEVDKFPEFTRELLQVQWRPDDPLDLYVVRPAGLKKPPVVIFLYGYPTDTTRFLNNELCKTYVKNGFAAVGFVSALTGSRYHDRPMKEWFVSDLPEALGTSVHDVQMVLEYLQTRGDLDTTRVGIFGQGSGGTIAILSAAADPRITAVDVMEPWGDWTDWLATSPLVPAAERADYLKPEFLKSVAPFDPVQWESQLQGRPFRLQEAIFDARMPQRVRNKLEAALPPAADKTTYSNLAEYQQRVSVDGSMLTWLSDKLGASLKDHDSLAASRQPDNAVAP